MPADELVERRIAAGPIALSSEEPALLVLPVLCKPMALCFLRCTLYIFARCISMKFACIVAVRKPLLLLPGLVARSPKVHLLDNLSRDASLQQRVRIREARAKIHVSGAIRDAPWAQNGFLWLGRIDRSNVNKPARPLATRADRRLRHNHACGQWVRVIGKSRKRN